MRSIFVYLYHVLIVTFSFLFLSYIRDLSGVMGLKLIILMEKR